MVSDTVYFKHNCITILSVTKTDEIIRAAKDLTQALQKHLLLQVWATNYEQVAKVVKIVDKIAKEKVDENKWKVPAVARVLQRQMKATSQKVEEKIPPTGHHFRG